MIFHKTGTLVQAEPRSRNRILPTPQDSSPCAFAITTPPGNHDSTSNGADLFSLFWYFT